MRFLPRRRRRREQIRLFCYHRTGTVLLSKIFRQISKANDWKFEVLYGAPRRLPRGADVLLFGHSMVSTGGMTTPFVGVHVIRDPREVVASGYLNHQYTVEEWCRNRDFDLTPPIRFPKVPLSQEGRSEEWKRRYIASLGGKSYQENLLGLSQHDGVQFEMNHYAGWTIDAMRTWDYGQEAVLEMKFEELMADFDGSFGKMFRHFNLTERETARALAIAAEHDLSRKSGEEVKSIKHVTDRRSEKWREYLDAEHRACFLQRFGCVLVDLGYEPDDAWINATADP